MILLVSFPMKRERNRKSEKREVGNFFLADIMVLELIAAVRVFSVLFTCEIV